MFVAIKDKLQIGAPVIVAGSWGSELSRRGARLDRRLWTAPISTETPEVLADVVRDYAMAGADVILANTFSTGPLLMSELGLLDEMREWDHAAVRIARETLASMPDCPAALAGSFSVFGAERVDPLFEAKVETLVRAGCEMIYMERIGGLCRAQLAAEVAVASGLPVWVELAVARADDGLLHGAGATGWLLTASASRTAIAACRNGYRASSPLRISSSRRNAGDGRRPAYSAPPPVPDRNSSRRCASPSQRAESTRSRSP